ncbi:aspartate-semialdehyde dehydrogenase [Tepidibacillus fermentans]|uniref:Aspartate-semialdehyde dehydrogenase n=2 Tax=Tepidibacillus fermentans TaxID=1281767 RepID=A0A4R3KHS8_9BACI|nr:aspartate-semialdehyde dehydrogenase [Tepidibacillus fermentans]TCS82999.1 aspartate-semialdehyde dehydrogenase [Tepidibacillus fermentans]
MMKKKSSYNVAVVGATGAVGQKMIQLLEERDFPVQQLKLLASSRSKGTVLQFKGAEVIVEEATPESFEGIDIALFSAGGKTSKQLAPHAVKSGAVVIDNSNGFRMDSNVPLVVPEVNIEDIQQHQGIIANPNCSTIQMVTALKPLYDRYGIERIIVSTYQAVSGAGYQAIQELKKQTEEVLKGEEVTKKILPVSSLPIKKQIAFNAIPQIDIFEENGFTLEEMKMVRETKKIFHDPQIQVTATCVRIPVVYGHSESVYVELKQDYNLAEVLNLLKEAPGIVVVDDPANQEYPLAIDAAGKLDVYVGRIRKDLNHPRALNMWIVSDNLLKGAAWNAVQIAEELIKNAQ